MSLLYYDNIDFTTKVVLARDVFKWKDIAIAIKYASDQYDLVLKNALKPQEKTELKKGLRKRKGLRPF